MNDQFFRFYQETNPKGYESLFWSNSLVFRGRKLRPREVERGQTTLLVSWGAMDTGTLTSWAHHCPRSLQDPPCPAQLGSKGVGEGTQLPISQKRWV